ncbi:3-isopropylmalate dehydratase small subunit [Erythrobacter sp. YT30]|uniref:3-isopropylmalate dehydratase small subunit n=1 Tax=Erythrobacter sp. YT30 TaxID=1735012 RepID=UPI00076CCF3F|nr:3-isopropylmalate dehydratase small subunit [Erythrobacter sp. YT30]KWV90804.1 3-isopropylmalate dehydratase [Erythrobacter sp. YT30]
MSAFPQPFTALAAPLIRDNVDTDMIIPSREMRTTGRDGLAEGMFAPWRYTDADARIENPDFVLNQPEYRDAKLLLASANFGCGSSREHAVWALAEFGIKAIIAESFAPIFRGNCVRNFILPIALPRDVVEHFAACEVTIDLEAQTVTSDGATHSFDIEAEAKQMLAHGLDAIDLTLTQAGAIQEWLNADKPARPWVYLEHSR